MKRDDRGVVVILYAFAMTGIVTMAALVLDIAQLRSDRRTNKTVADMAVRAGLGVLQAGPWSGVCRAKEYVRTNSPGFSSFDAGSEKWFQLGTPLSQLTSSPCLNTSTAPFVNHCLPGELGVPRTDTWGRLTATAGGGRFRIEIQSGYTMPDSQFPEDQLAVADTGDPLKGSCDNLVVVISERRSQIFGDIVDKRDRTTTIRSVGRISSISTGEYNPALLLLERQKCDVLVTGGTNTRVIAQPYLDHPGVIQIDSAVACANGQAVLNGAKTSGGASIVACSARTALPTPGCTVATGNKPSRIGIYALNFSHPPGHRVTSDYHTDLGQSTYGDTRAVPSAQSGRAPLDHFYRKNVQKLDADAKAVLTGNGGLPPGCIAVVNSSCTGNGLTWLVLQQADCNTLTGPVNFFNPPVPVVPPRTLAQNIWFNCDLSVKTPLALEAFHTYVVVTGQLHVVNTFSINDPRTVYVGGRSAGNKIGLEVGNGGVLSINRATALDCSLRAGVGRYAKVVVGNGAMNVSSGGAAHLCQSFVYLASGFGTVPKTDNTEPCSTPCGNYLGTLSIGSGASVDWSAPNLITNRRPKFVEVDLSGLSPPVSPYEDLGFWTEAGGNSNTINGNGASKMTGVFFLGNADAFNLAGNSGADVYLSAQFIARTMKVTGGAVVNLVINPLDSIPVVVYELLLVR